MGDFIAPNVLEGNPSVNTKVSSTARLGSNKPFPIRVTPGLNRATSRSPTATIPILSIPKPSNSSPAPPAPA